MSCQPSSDESFPILLEIEISDSFVEHYLKYPQNETEDNIRDFNFRYPEITDQELTLLIDMLLVSRDGFLQHKPNVGQRRQKFPVKIKLKAKIKGRLTRMLLNCQQNLEEIPPRFNDTHIIHRLADDNGMVYLFVNPTVLMIAKNSVKPVSVAWYPNSAFFRRLFLADVNN